MQGSATGLHWEARSAGSKVRKSGETRAHFDEKRTDLAHRRLPLLGRVALRRELSTGGESESAAESQCHQIHRKSLHGLYVVVWS